MNTNFKLDGISETLLIPLMGRALETKKENGILRDLKSLEIYEGLAYDFQKFQEDESRRSMLRTTIRTAIIDEIVKNYLKKHPDITVVEIGCGLNTRFERLDEKARRWFDLDVPQVYKVWKLFFQEDSVRSFLPYSAFDLQWMKEVRQQSSGPYFFISEASLIYFSKEKVRSFFLHLHQNFPDSYYLFDSATPAFLKQLKKSKDALKYCNVTLKWTIEDIDRLKEWVPDIQILKTINLEDADHEFAGLYPKDFTKQANGYRLNLVRT